MILTRHYQFFSVVLVNIMIISLNLVIFIVYTSSSTLCSNISIFAASNNMVVSSLAITTAADTEKQWMPVTCAFAYSWTDNTTGSKIHSAFCNVNGQWQTAYNCTRIFYAICLYCSVMPIRTVYLNYI